jgi:hypothetical protein
MRDTTTNRLRHARVAFAFVAILTATPLRAQATDSIPLSPNYWNKLWLGVTTSILLHEAAHVLTSVAVGGDPSFGFDNLRPTVYSGLSTQTDPHKQFLFSISGLVMQTLVNEAILDIPHRRGSAFERGVLGGGIGTTLFYLTIGRRGAVSDVEYIARTGGMTKAQVTLLFGSFAALHTFRISRDKHYANFFARPRGDGGMEFGIWLR